MEQPINIIFMGNFEYPNGMANSKRIQYFIDYLTGNSVSAGVLLLRQGGVTVLKSERDGIYRGVQFRTIGNDIRLSLNLLVALPMYFIKGMMILYGWKRKRSKNILYCYNGLTLENLLFVIAAKLMGYLTVMDVVEDNTYLQEKLHLFAKIKWVTNEMLENHITKFANALVVISLYLKNLYENALGDAIPISLIPISADCSKQMADQKSGQQIKIVYSGSFAKKDGVELLIEAFENISRSHNNCMLLLTGKGANLPAILDRIADNPAIRHVGYLSNEEFYDFLHQADILCITRIGSKYANAGFPFKLGEYLATGNPVIVSNVSDVSRYLENMKDAVIIEADNINAIEKALAYCISNPEEARKIGANGRAKCKEHFNPATNGQKLLELLYQLN